MCVICGIPHKSVTAADHWTTFTRINKKASIRYVINRFLWNYLQESQHPLTWQHAANFRLLANQWAEHRLVTQWHHGCRTTRQSVCNAGASNAGRSLCVQISREQSYPLPIYWYHSKGNWLHYNTAAESFYIMKLCSTLFILYCRNCSKDDKFRYFIPILRKLGEAQNLGWWLVGNPVSSSC